MHEKFAEALYILQMHPKAFDHYIFNQAALTDRFPGISKAQWFEAVMFLQLACMPGESIHSHYRALKQKRARVQQQPDPEPQPAQREPSRHRRMPRSDRRVWTDAKGNAIYTDTEGNVLGDESETR